MTWTPLAAPRPSHGSGSGGWPVSMTMSQGDGRFARRISIAVRPALLEGGLPFWVPGQTVSVAVGAGEHAGLLRIEPAHQGLSRLYQGGGRGMKAIMLKLPVLAGMSAGLARQPPIACEHDWSDTWLEITLPAWARPKPAGEISPAPRAAVGVAPGTPMPNKANPFGTSARLAERSRP